MALCETTSQRIRKLNKLNNIHKYVIAFENQKTDFKVLINLQTFRNTDFTVIEKSQTLKIIANPEENDQIQYRKAKKSFVNGLQQMQTYIIHFFHSPKDLSENHTLYCQKLNISYSFAYTYHSPEAAPKSCTDATRNGVIVLSAGASYCWHQWTVTSWNIL